MDFKKEKITSIGELVSQRGGRNLTPVFEGTQFPTLVYVTKEEFETVRGNKEAMKDLAILKLNTPTTINFLGAELDSSKEYELFKNDGLGFNITVGYTADSWNGRQGFPFSTFKNCTEFHWRYNEKSEISVKESAFESDIHGTGCTRKVNEIISVLIEYATEVAESY